MKSLLALVACFSSMFLSANHESLIFSKDRLVNFYDEFLLEEKEILAEVGLTSGGFLGDPFLPPPNPPAPPFKTGYLPIVLVNNSSYPDDQVYVLLTGKTVDTSVQVWGSINTSYGSNSGVVSLVTVQDGQNGETYSQPLSSLPRGSTGRVIYLPETRSGLVWFSVGQKLNMPVSANTIVQPSFDNPADPNYNTNFDIFEFTYLASTGVYADATAVSFFSMPLYGYLAGATSVSSNTGLYQPRSYIMSHMASEFSSTVESSQWSKLLLTSGSNVLRCLSTQKAIAASLFDDNYLDNSASYGFSYINDIWDGGSAYYKSNDMNMSVTVTVPSTATYSYTGGVNVSNEFVFTSGDGGPTVTIPAPVTGPTYSSTTSYLIFAAQNLISPSVTAGTADDAVSKLLEESIIAGLVPTTDTLSLSYLSSNQSNFYQVNNNLQSPGPTTGPWYDVYSKGLHSLGSIYTYGFDEPLWPQVLLQSPFQNNSTYLGITICTLK